MAVSKLKIIVLHTMLNYSNREADIGRTHKKKKIRTFISDESHITSLNTSTTSMQVVEPVTFLLLLNDSVISFLLFSLSSFTYSTRFVRISH